MRRPSERKQDRSPYGSSVAVGGGMNAGMSNNAYLSPPMDSNWRRSNSDSALHQTLNMAVAAEGGFGPAGGMTSLGGLPGDMSALHANYQHHNQRSHSPNIGRSFSPQAQRRKGQMLQHQQQQQQQHLHHSQQHLHLQQQHQQLQQQFQQQHHMHQQQTQQQQHVQQQQQHAQQPANNVGQQHQQHFNAKFNNNCNIPGNSLFKSLQEQTLALANTGSLPDLTTLHYSPAQQPMLHQQQQQQQTLSPILSPHNNGRERDQSPSPFSPAGGAGNGTVGGPPSTYQQQQHSPTSAANTPTAAQTSPHLSFTNLAVQSPTGNGSNTTNTAQTGTFTNLPTLGAASSTGNLTEYRQPLNPPSPGSSPGLLTSASGNDVVHISAPASPIRHPQAGMIGQSIQNYNEKNMQAFDRYSPAMGVGALDAAGFNSLNSSFHNHFEQFTLGDSNSSPEQQQQLQQHFQQQQQQRQQQQQNSFAQLDFDDFSTAYNQSLSQSKQLDFSDLTGVSTSTAATATQNSRGVTCNTNNGGNTSNNNNTHQATRILSQQQQQQQLLNNNGGVTAGSNNAISNPITNGPMQRISNNNVNLAQANDVNSSPIPSPLGCLPSPSSPLPIPINAQSPHHQHQQLSLSLHSHSAQPSPHHSPLHSPHHASPLSSSSPGITTLTGGGTPGNGSNNATSAHHNQQQQATQHHHHQHHTQQHHSQHHQHLQNHANTPTNTNIPAIVFSDYSSREIFDSLDLDLGQMDETALDLLADQNSMMIADPTIEDSFRKDLN
ncbi:unnamed protein product [Ceratitis capitata]|uniref:(Mediterranean fruit fly) hypothetical protein n=1 Tax=Ceratitis capitata TaxID=7213 RepID=A0A811UYV2_CERCA|nr:unnamed protein product [Ceratitis capitata]